jgi:ribosomal protein S27AE
VGVNTLGVNGNPDVELYLDVGEPPTLITVCSSCGQMRTILFLDRDRWLCVKCRAEGAAPPSLYPLR